MIVAVNDAMIVRYRSAYAKRVASMKGEAIFGLKNDITNWNELMRDALILDFVGGLKSTEYGDEELKEILHKLKK